MKLQYVSFAGVDDAVDVNEMVQMSQHYPIIEWSVLLSKVSMGKKRYPSLEWLKKLYLHPDRPKNISGHLCGEWVKQLFLESGTAAVSELAEIWDMFTRVQINYVDYWNDVRIPGTYLGKSKILLNNLKVFSEKDLILPHNKYSVYFLEYNQLPENTQILYDNSMGLGIDQTEWLPPYQHYLTGYAGGLGPENIGSHLMLFDQFAPGKIWIDMESKVRNLSNEFDMKKADQVMHLASYYS